MSQDGEFPDAVAIIGMSCRFAPDLDSLEKFWAFLAGGRTAVADMPAKRWDPYAASNPQATAILRSTTRKGAFLDDIEGFDADFFGISPREADFLDPQQRIMLELAWEALHHAGLPPLSLRGTDAGVYVAANSNDYGRRLLEDLTRTGAWAVNGTTYYGIANRISYFLDLRGASMAVDTACAGSLTALHLACRSLCTGETPVALVGGVNIMATPALMVALDAAGATAPDGRSKAFDRTADGYGRGEGAGVLVLKRLADARRDGDRVLALIRGSGAFQDGRSDGMMAPRGDAQIHMLAQTYQRAGIDPATVDYVEAHGTGTPVGDREEAQALAGVFGAGRAPGDPCLIGSLKPNIGHVEAGSGIAGVIKTVLALQHGQLPPSLHTEPNPEFDWAASGLRLVGELTAWDTGGHPRRAGVSSYGVGGSISHVILEEAPAPTAHTAPDTDAAVRTYPLSAMSEPGLRALAARTADWLTEHPDAAPAAVAHTLTERRSHLPQRAAVVAAGTAEAAEKMRAFAAGETVAGVTAGRALPGAGNGVVWVFSGHGAQWPGMGRDLLRDAPAFGAAIDALDAVFDDELGWTPRAALTAGGPWTSVEVQALTVAVQIGLIAVWREHGCRPAAVIGHSVGEIAAAVCAGVLDPVEAARFACRRAKALAPLAGHGAMVLVGLPFDEVSDRLAGRVDVVAAIAAGPRSTVVSGDRDAVTALAERWRSPQVPVWSVDTDIAFHSPHADPAVPAVTEAADALHPRPARSTLYSTALDDPRDPAPRDGRYWATNLRAPVRFAAAVRAAAEDGHRIFLEVSSHPVVTHSITETLTGLGIDDTVVTGSLRRDRDEVSTLLAARAALYCAGAHLAGQPGGELADLPTAAWQHRPYWIFGAGGPDAGTGGGHDPRQHTLLGGRTTVSGAPPRQVWQTYLDMSCRPYPLDHEVVGVEITPAAVLINSFVHAAAGDDGRLPALSDVVLRTPLAVTPPRIVQTVLAENTARLSTRVVHDDDASGDPDEWITHSTATIDRVTEVEPGELDLSAIRGRCPQEWDWQRVDAMFRRMGVGGYAFPWDVNELLRNDQEQFADLTIVAPPAQHAASWAHVIDGALTISAVLVTPEYSEHQWMSSHIDAVAFRGEPPARITVHSVRSPRSPHDTVDVLIGDEHGDIVGLVRGLTFSAIEHEHTAAAPPHDLVHEITWRPLELTAGGHPEGTEIALLGDDATAARLAATGLPCHRLTTPDELTTLPAGTPLLVVVAPTAGPAGPVGASDPADAGEEAAWTLIRAAQCLSERQQAGDAAAPARLWCLTRGVREAADPAALAHAPLWGAARIIAGEHPEIWGGLTDLDGDTLDGTTLAAVLAGAAGQEDVIALSADGAAVPRLARIDRPAESAGLQCRPADTYLITGGLGALGLLVARWLADRGARRILLAGRRSLPPRAAWDQVTEPRVRRQIDGLLELEALGVTVRTVAVDITDASAVARALDPAVHGMPPIRGVVHAAGVVRDAMVDKTDRDQLRDVLDPKARGAMVLHELFPPGTLDFFVLFSSCGQFARLTGQATYAAANSFLDALARHRHAAGDTGTRSIGWTAWRGVGMSESITMTMLEANARGLDAVSVPEALRCWAFADRYASPYQAVLRVLPTPGARVPMLRELDATRNESTPDNGPQAVDWTALTPDELRERVAIAVGEQVAAELNLAAGDVDVRRPLVELGVDSVMTVALRVRLQRTFGLDLPPNILWSRPHIAALTDHITEALGTPA
ncbi:type I polyketide synthase [Actinoplanes teichomyceticus]|uniref:6-methylsalicylic acid synthase n=1 Tax=Actinoplanes teichomyceticus TaxID=1867 RepID=A0A561WBW8_ACTTI|nr:type I polyketide synthase [Actinoplanes teichomyceticus]TWG21349.1 6-methylsalicylic acid synthase [Actinoplanes teichomyceticus]GIF16434.1 phthiocerol synthesis polyketide synthase type I PpsA [Actinoplanes teichomyceticus]